MTYDPEEHGRRANAWRYGEGTKWDQTQVWITGAGDMIPVEDLESGHLHNIINKLEQSNAADQIAETPLFRRLRELDSED